ncbi:neuropeptide CCHamide-2 [Ischnura elegans]|uniref:neuropeptide CCHamide-2 n=1 Tax=Ischnura elegans TaxID=197161 RepID=UPI001ED8AD0A|nr:neuropeptide CCHamide-2 [Ischnura elegans]
MRSRTSCPSVVLTIAVLTVFIFGTRQIVEAKRGCSAFGHSCFGGHGKRADVPSDVGSSDFQSMQQPSQEVFISTADEASPPYQDPAGPAYESSPQRFLTWSKMQPFLRQWLESYRRSTEGTETN